ncbi:glycerol-3-phosphate dehydrogenase, NAD-dependent [Tolypothrix sp. NIES-4075]|uniref:NAD(P)H-dependent glycerol-3-phosphate dehydrogenase n=1 Tax=Tolypothrix sp. NIES-4075 TaxID=2005459 RepID=UPI000B5CFE30|nr:glycerol-3-phosphate dehydrogenase [Tolypothrix sp. NIES-4075]GAX41793.1 glycerol-3-phosphate dehydrogenase, NAD-dependent [Tolypothrix sp. NIES-4075]
MAKILILGAGVMGTALSVPLTDNGHIVNLVGTHLDDDIIAKLQAGYSHPRLGIQVAESVTAYTCKELGEAIKGVDLVVIGVNSHGIEWAAQALGSVLSVDIPVLAVTKGLAGDGEKLSILPDVLCANLPDGVRERIQIAAIGGPSIAQELAERRHTCVMFTSTNPALLEHLAQLARTPYYHIWTNTDIIGIEVCVALKNVYALAVGLVIGFLEKAGKAVNDAEMHNLAAAIFAQGMWETAYLVDKMKGKPESVYSLPGAGDLYVTCQGGRNSRMGRLLGLGIPYSQAKAEYMPNDTVEGASLALAIGQTVENMIHKGDLDAIALPLLRTMIDIVCHNAPAIIPWEKFFTR